MVNYDQQFHEGVVYGDQQARFTQMRAAYGDVGGAMMAGAGGGMGYAPPQQRGMAGLGQYISPLTYTAPARVLPSQGGFTQQQTGFFTGLGATLGMHDAPMSTSSSEYHYTAVSDFGERVGMGAATAGMVGGGMAAGVAARGAGRVVGAALGGGIGFMLAGPLGAKAGAAIGGFVGGEGMAIVGAMGGGYIMDQVAARRETQAMLEQESFRYVGAGSDLADPRFGRGMGSRGRLAAAEMVREMDVADPDLDTSDLKNIMQGAGRMGLFSGAGQDIESFKRRFKEITDGVKQVASVLNTTLEEGLGVIRDMQQAGVDPSGVRGMVMRADATGMVAGLTGREMVNFGMQGAAMYRGTGIDMNIGMQSNMMNLASIRSARDAGAISEEAIRQAGGEQAFAQRMTAGSLAFTQTAQGRGMMAAMYDPSTGGINERILGQLTSGNMNLIQAYQQGARNISSPADLVRMEANQDKIMSDLGQRFGGQGHLIAELASNVMIASYEADQLGMDRKTVLRRNLLQAGKAPHEADMMIAKMENADKEYEANQASAAAARDKVIMDQADRSNIIYKTGARIEDFVKEKVDVVAKPVNEMVESVREGAFTFYEERIRGYERLDISDIETRRAYSASRAKYQKESKILDATRTTGLWHESTGETLMDAIEEGRYGKDAKDLIQTVSLDDLEEFTQKHGPVTIVERSAVGRDIKVITRKNEKDLKAREQILRKTDAQIDKLHEDGVLPDTTEKFRSALMKGNLDGATTINQVIEGVTGESIANVTAEEKMSIMRNMRQSNRLKEILEKDREKGTVLANMDNAAYINNQAKIKREYDDIADNLGEKYLDIGDMTAGTFDKILNLTHLKDDLKAAKGDLRGMDSSSNDYAAKQEEIQNLEQQIKDQDADLFNEFENIYGKTGAEQRATHKRLHIMLDRGQASHYIEAGRKIEGEISTNQQKQGVTAWSRAISEELLTSKTALNVREKAIGQRWVKKFSGRVADIRTMTEEERDIIGKTAMGQRMIAIGDIAEKVYGDEPIKQDEIETLLAKVGLGEDQKETAAAQIANGGGREVLSNLMNNTMRDLAGDKGVGGNIIGTGEGGVIDPYAEYAKQTNMNQQTLLALTALNDEIKKMKGI